MADRPNDPEGPGGRQDGVQDRDGLGAPSAPPADGIPPDPPKPAATGTPGPDPTLGGRVPDRTEQAPEPPGRDAAKSRLQPRPDAAPAFDEAEARRQLEPHVDKLFRDLAKDEAAARQIALVYLNDGFDPTTAASKAMGLMFAPQLGMTTEDAEAFFDRRIRARRARDNANAQQASNRPLQAQPLPGRELAADGSVSQQKMSSRERRQGSIGGISGPARRRVTTGSTTRVTRASADAGQNGGPATLDPGDRRHLEEQSLDRLAEQTTPSEERPDGKRAEFGDRGVIVKTPDGAFLMMDTREGATDPKPVTLHGQKAHEFDERQVKARFLDVDLPMSTAEAEDVKERVAGGEQVDAVTRGRANFARGKNRVLVRYPIGELHALQRPNGEPLLVPGGKDIVLDAEDAQRLGLDEWSFIKKPTPETEPKIPVPIVGDSETKQFVGDQLQKFLTGRTPVRDRERETAVFSIIESLLQAKRLVMRPKSSSPSLPPVLEVPAFLSDLRLYFDDLEEYNRRLELWGIDDPTDD